MSCLSCKEAYDQERRPRVLQCGHSACGSCTLELHRLNCGVIPCPECGREDYCADVTKLIVNLDLEARLTNLHLEEEEQEEDYEEDHGDLVAAGGTAAEGSGSPWDICSFHGSPLSSWCTTCRHAVCSECRQFHEGRHHAVVDHVQAKELLLSRYKDESQAFLEWLVKVEAATRDTLEATKAAVPPLRETLSLVRRHISRIRSHERALEGAASLETLEDLLEKRSRWNKRSQAAAQQQVDDGVASLVRLESCVAELRRLQREVEDGFAQGAGGGGEGGGGATSSTTASLPHPEEDHDDQRQQQDDTVAPATPEPTTRVVLAQRGPLSVVSGQSATVVELGGPETEGRLGTRSRRRSTTHIEFRADGETKFVVRHRDDAGRDLLRTRWYFVGGSTGLLMETWDPTRPPHRDNPRFVDVPVYGLRVGAHHRARIEEDEEQYEVFLDGVSKGNIQKAGGPRPSADAKIVLYNDSPPGFRIDVLKILVETE